MANQVLPSRNIHSNYAIKSINGLRDYFLQGYEAKTMQKAMDKLDPDATPEERMQKLMGLNVSNETKKMGMEYFKNLQKNQPTLAGSSKALASIAQQSPEAKFHIENLNTQELQGLLQDMTRSGGNLDAAFSSLEESMQAKQQGRSPRWMQSQGQQSPDQQSQPGQAPETEEKSRRENARFLGKHTNTDRLKSAFMQSDMGKLFLQKDPKALEQLAKEKPEVANDWISNYLGTFAIDLPAYAAGVSLLGPAGGMATVKGLSEAADRAKQLYQKKHRGENLTGDDLREAVTEVVRESGKGALLGYVMGSKPLQWIMKKVPGGEKLLESAIVRGAAGSIEMGLIAPESAELAFHQKPQTWPNRVRNYLLGLGFEATGMIGGKQKPTEQAPDLGWQSGGEGSPFKTGGLQMGPEQGPPPKTMQEMVSGVQGGQETLQMRTQAQKAEAAASLKPQPQQAAAPQPPQEPIAPESMPAQPLAKETRPSVGEARLGGIPNAAQSGSMQNAAAMSELQGRVKPMPREISMEGGKVPRPQAQPEMDMLAREQRMGQMRGEKPFIPEGEVPVKPGEMTETMQGRVAKGEQLQKEIGKLRDQVRELNALEHERSITPEANRTTLDNQITQLKDQINVQKKLARKLQKEIQTGRESLSDEKIEEALSRRRAKMIEEASAEKAKTDKEVAKAQLKKKAVEEKVKEAKKLLKQAEKMPSDYSDSFIRVKQRYVDEFSRVRDIAKKEMDMSDVGSQEYRVAQRMHDEASAIVKEAQADLTIHKAKKSAEHAAETAKKEAQIKAREKTGQKVEKLTPKKFNEFKKTLKEHAEKPTKETTEKLAEQIGVKPEVVKETTQSAQAEGKKFAERIIKPLKVEKKAPKAEAPKTEIPKGELPKAKEGSLTEALEQTKKGTQPTISKEDGGFRGIKEMFKETTGLIKNLSRGEFKEIWKNPFGRALIVQSVLSGFSSVIKDEGIKGVSFSSLGGAIIGSGGVQGFQTRTIAMMVINTVKGIYKHVQAEQKINRYNEYSRQGKYKEAMALKLTPKQIKEAKEKRYK